MFPNLISSENDDKIFLKASELIFDKKNNIWDIVLQPSKELVVLNSNISKDLPTVKDIRDFKIDIYENNDKIYYKGSSLFSAGVIFIVNDKFVMLQRDEGAPVDAGKWTCPAGRCSTMPFETSLKEFYEELAVFDNEGAVLFKIPGIDENIARKIYKETFIRKKEVSLPIKEIPCEIAHEYNNCTINILRDGETFSDGQFWAAYDSICNTLEIRVVAKIFLDDELLAQLKIIDGELYNRKVDSFSIKELSQLPLVSTMKLFSADALKKSKKSNLILDR